MKTFTIAKPFTGDKYIYYLMAYKLCKANGDAVKIGNDNGYVGGQGKYRGFVLHSDNGRTILQERKNHRCFADLHRYFEVSNLGSETPTIKDYINEAGENGSNWQH